MLNDLQKILADRVNQRLNAMDEWVHKKEMQALPTILASGEKVEGIAEGTHQGKQGMLFTTDTRFLFVRKPLIGPTRHQDFLYHQVDALNIERYSATAVITLDMPDGRHTLDHISLRHIDALLEGLRHSKLADML